MPIYPLVKTNIPFKSQVIIKTRISLYIPHQTVAILTADPNPSPQEPLVCPGILDPAYLEDLLLLVCNLIDYPLDVGLKNPVAYVHLMNVDFLISVSPFGALTDMGLDENLSILSLPNIGPGLSPAEQQSAEKLLNSFAELFSSGPHDFGLMKGTTHQLHLEQMIPIRAAPYQKSKVEEAQVAIELKQLLEARLLQAYKSP